MAERRRSVGFSVFVLAGGAMLASGVVGAEAWSRARAVTPPLAAPANGDSGLSGVAMSANGRYVAFPSEASNLVAGDTNRKADVFVRDRVARTTQRLSVSSAGKQANDASWGVAISASGRFVAFASKASNLVAGDTNRKADVFVRDRVARTTERVSVSAGGAQAKGWSWGAAISADGRVIAFASNASNLVAGEAGGFDDVFVRDRVARTTERVSLGSASAEAGNDGDSYDPVLGANGRVVAFTSEASNLVAGDTNRKADVFVRDRAAGTTERVSVSSAGKQANGLSDWASISAGGRFIAFGSEASDLVAGDTNRSPDVFVRDRVVGTTERISVSSAGKQANAGGRLPSISADGDLVAFDSKASNLVAGDTNDCVYENCTDVFVRRRAEGTTERASVSTGARQASGLSYGPSISADGRFVAFVSSASNLVPADRNWWSDVFLRDRGSDTTTLTSVGSMVRPKVTGPVALWPSPARAGQRLSATVPVSGVWPESARVSCIATIAAHRLTVITSSFRWNSVRCVWQAIPKNADGERLHGLLSVFTPGGTASRHFAGSVR